MLRGTSTLGERHPLQVGRVLKQPCAFQGFASGRSVRHGTCLLQRRQRFQVQILIGPLFDLFPVHPRSLGIMIIACLLGSGRWNLGVHWICRNQTACWPLPILEVCNEQRKTHR